MAIERLDHIAEAFAAAAIDSSRWPTAMEIVSEATVSYGAALFPLRGRLPFLPQSRSMAPSFERYIKDGWVTRDERYRAVPVILQRGVATELDFTTSEEMARHPYYQEFLAPFRLRWWAGVKFACGDDVWCLSLQRTPAQGPFSDDEQHQLADLSTRLSAAGALVTALNFARAEAALAAFDASGKAILLLGRQGDVIRANAAAERLLGAGIDIVDRRLVSAHHQATAGLDRAIHQLLWHRSSVALMPPVVLPRHGQRPLLAYLLRLDAAIADALGPCQVAVVLVDPDRRGAPPEEDLRVAFGLTAAEARLAVLFATGRALDESAELLGISTETARSQLKQVFSKTETERQGELVALLARLPASRHDPGRRSSRPKRR